MDFVGDAVRNNNDLIGTFAQREFIDGGLDAGYIADQSYAPFLYFGPPNSTRARAVRGTDATVPGLAVCFSGAFTGENCAARVEITDGCAFFEDTLKMTCGLSSAVSTN